MHFFSAKLEQKISKFFGEHFAEHRFSYRLPHRLFYLLTNVMSKAFVHNSELNINMRLFNVRACYFMNPVTGTYISACDTRLSIHAFSETRLHFSIVILKCKRVSLN